MFQVSSLVAHCFVHYWIIDNCAKKIQEPLSRYEDLFSPVLQDITISVAVTGISNGTVIIALMGCRHTF